MIRRTGVYCVVMATKPKMSSSSFLSTIEKGKSAAKFGDEEVPMSTFIPSVSKTPELLQPYVEPKPFVSAKRIQVFLVSVGIGAATIWTVYYLLSRAMSTCIEEEQRLVELVVESNRLGMQDPHSFVPDFTAPSSFAELQEKMQRYEEELSKQQENLDRGIVMLHAEIVFRAKIWWNSCLKHLQQAIDRFGITLQKRKERAAVMHIREVLEREGYELVNLHNAKKPTV